jgi:hypothetical protein
MFAPKMSTMKGIIGNAINIDIHKGSLFISELGFG